MFAERRPVDESARTVAGRGVVRTRQNMDGEGQLYRVNVHRSVVDRAKFDVYDAADDIALDALLSLVDAAYPEFQLRIDVEPAMDQYSEPYYEITSLLSTNNTRTKRWQLFVNGDEKEFDSVYEYHIVPSDDVTLKYA